MIVFKNDIGKNKEVRQLPSNMARALKTKHWVMGAQKKRTEFAGFTGRSYEALKRMMKDGGPRFGDGRAVTVQVLDKKTIYLENSYSSQYILKFKTNAEQKDWIAENIVNLDQEIHLG